MIDSEEMDQIEELSTLYDAIEILGPKDYTVD